jgi:hypothetical protein
MKVLIPMRTIGAVFAAGAVLAAAAAGAQTLPAGPAELAGGTIAISGEIDASIGSRDDSAFFNYTDYEHNALRMFRVALAGAWRPVSRVAVLTEIRSEDRQAPLPYALYLRVRPFAGVPFDVQAGRIPPVFGTFARRAYGTRGNPLIGYPLAYQYLTSLRADAIPGNADDLVAMRARGWRASYPVGDRSPAPGVPLISAFRWDTGVEASLSTDRFDAALSITRGTLAAPRVRDDNGGRQLAARVAWKPIPGLVVGGSFARGEFLAGALSDRYRAALGSHAYAQTAAAADGEYSRGHLILRGELIASRWRLPAVGLPLLPPSLGATSGYVEGSYRLSPRWYIAARGDALTFSRVTPSARFGGGATTWDAPVQRVEAGGGYYLQRNLILRAVVQQNWRDGGRVRRRTFTSAQLAYWF